MTPPEDSTQTAPEAHSPGLDDWRSKVETELGPGRDFARSLVTRTLEGLDIQPLYGPGGKRSGPSFTLGSGGWAVAPLVGHPSPSQGNRDLLEDLSEGATGCFIQLGRAPKGLPKAGAAGELWGVDVRDLGSLDRLLDGVFLDAIPVAFESSANGLPLAATFAALCKERGVALEETRPQFAMDPIGALARDGSLPGDMADARAELCKLASYSRLHLNHGRSLAVDAGVWHRGGAHAAQELGFAVATFVQYLRWLEEDGLAPAQACVEFVWRFDLGRDVFGEIAKLRAARELHARVLGSMGIEDAPALVIGATTSTRGLCRRDPWTNMLRTSLGVFAGATGGADMITALPFDAPLGLPSALGRRNARNTQLVLAHESRLEHVGDPARGSHYVEARTEELCEAAWDVFLAVEEEGGMAAALENDWVAGEVDRARGKLREEVATRRRPLVGVSEFPGDWLEGAEQRGAAAAKDIEAAARAEDTRIGARGTIALGAIDEFAHARDAASGGATLEEIGGALVRGAPLSMEPIPGFREASVFENLVAAAAGLPSPPKVLLACLGHLADHAGRAGFATQLLRAGGFEIEQSKPDLSGAELGAWLGASGATLVCLAGSDEAYGSAAAAEALAALRKSGARAVWVAAPPGRAAKALEDEDLPGHLDGHLYLGCDAESALIELLRLSGADLPEVSL